MLVDNIAAASISIILAYAFGGAYFAPHSSGSPDLAPEPIGNAAVGYWWFVILVFTVAADQLLVAGGKALRLTPDALSVVNAALLVLGGDRALAAGSCRRDRPVAHREEDDVAGERDQP